MRIQEHSHAGIPAPYGIRAKLHNAVSRSMRRKRIEYPTMPPRLLDIQGVHPPATEIPLPG